MDGIELGNKGNKGNRGIWRIKEIIPNPMGNIFL